MSTDSNPNPDSNPAPAAKRYFRMNSRKLSYGEYWNIAGSWKVIIPWFAKFFNLPIKFTSGIPSFESVKELEVAESDFSPRAREQLQPSLEQCLRLGFQGPRFYTYATMRGEVRTSFISLLHSSGATLRLMQTLASNSHPPVEKMNSFLLSELSDGTYFVTSSQKAQFKNAPGIVVNRLVGAPVERLVDAHLQKIAGYAMSTPARPVESAEGLDDLWNRYERLCRDFGFARGVYVWMAPEEAAADRTRIDGVRALAQGVGAEHIEVLMEMDKLQNKKAGWGNVILILIVSLVLFMAAGSRQWSWSYVLILVPVLFVHELGHYVAMRTFNYRNLRMFFIPFFGAAVSGRNYNVAGWKKVIVSLMGPAPGIFLGVAIGGAGLMLHKAVLTKVALVMLILNGFNLLPILPFDGGWVCHALLFSRHYLMDTVFRVVAAILLMAGGVLSHNKVLMYLGIPMLLSIPVTHRLARIATALRGRGIPATPEDDQTIPPETAKAIIDELKKSTPKPQPNKVLAQQTLQIFETLNARPPGWAATFGLLFAHGASLGMAVVFVVVFVVGRRANMADLDSVAAAFQPTHAVECGSLAAWNENQTAGEAEGPGVTLIASFAKRDGAVKMFGEMTNRLPAAAALRLFGDNLLLHLPASLETSQKKWVAALGRQATNVLVAGTNSFTGFTLKFRAPDEQTAKNLETEMNGYLSTLPYEGLVPPWHPHDVRPAEEKARHDLARRTYNLLVRPGASGADSEEVTDLQKKMMTAYAQGDEASGEALSQEMRHLMEIHQARHIEQVRNGALGPVDAGLVDLYKTWSSEARKKNDPDRQGMAERLGQLPKVEGKVSRNEARYSSSLGSLSHKGATVDLSYILFDRVEDGAPALVEWLCGQGCTDFRYSFSAGGSLQDAEGD